MGAQELAAGQPSRKAPGIDNGQPEASRRHGVLTRVLVLVERDLHKMPDLRHQRRRRVAIRGPC
jgi:hypothetical protein